MTGETFADNDLITGITKGDTKSIDILYQRYSPVVFTYVSNVLQDHDAAEDVLQDVFITIWKSAGKFRGDSSVKTWILGISHNLAISWLRNKKHVKNIDDDSLSEIPDQIHFELNYQTTDELNLALSQLTPTHRSIIELAYYHQLSQLEIAQVLNCPQGTVKSRINAALIKLNKFLKH